MLQAQMNRYAAARAATTLSALAVLSPLAGMAAEMALAWRFGASPTVDAFRVGALVLLFGQQLFVLHILPHAVVPVFTDYRVQGREQEAWHAAISLTTLLMVPALLAALLVFFRPEPVARFLAPGLVGDARAMAYLFVRWFLPACVLMVWTGILTGVFYAHKIFWLPQATQLASNILLVGLILSLGRTLGPASLVLAVLLSVVLSVALYASQLIRLLGRVESRLTWKPDITHPGACEMLRLAWPLLGTLLLAQWSAIVVNRALSLLPPGCLAQFGYAWKLGQLASLFPLSLATVMFPRFAEAYASCSGDAFQKVCTRALRMALFFAIPLACLFYALRQPVVETLFQRGAFSAEVTEGVARLFGLLLLGTPAYAAVVHMEKISYARHQMRIPLCVQFLSTVVVTLSADRVARRLGVEGLMLLAGGVLPLLAASALFVWLCGYCGASFQRELIVFAGGILPLALVSAWVGHSAAAAASLWAGEAFADGLVAFVRLATGTFVFCGIFVSFALGWRVPEALQCRDYLCWQGSSAAGKLHDLVFGRT